MFTKPRFKISKSRILCFLILVFELFSTAYSFGLRRCDDVISHRHVVIYRSRCHSSVTITLFNVCFFNRFFRMCWVGWQSLLFSSSWHDLRELKRLWCARSRPPGTHCRVRKRRPVIVPFFGNICGTSALRNYNIAWWIQAAYSANLLLFFFVPLYKKGYIVASVWSIMESKSVWGLAPGSPNLRATWANTAIKTQIFYTVCS